MLTLEKIGQIERVAQAMDARRVATLAAWCFIEGGQELVQVQLLVPEVQELCRCGRVVAQLLAVHEAKAQKLRKFRAENPIAGLSKEEEAALHTHEMMIKLLKGEV